MSRIMIVDDEEGILNALRRLLLRAPCQYGSLVYRLEVETFLSPLAALDRARVATFDLVMSDYGMAELNGVEFLQRMEEIQPDATRLILSGCSDINVINQNPLQTHIYGILPKPWNDYLLMSMLAQALNHRDLQLENRELARQAKIVRDDPAAPHPPRPVEWAADGSLLVNDLPEPKGDTGHHP